MLRQALGVTAGSGGVASALLAAGWTGVVLVAVLLLVVVGAVCWTIADPGRADRLALLITSWRSRTTAARTTRSVGSVKPKIPPAAPPKGKRHQ